MVDDTSAQQSAQAHIQSIIHQKQHSDADLEGGENYGVVTALMPKILSTDVLSYMVGKPDEALASATGLLNPPGVRSLMTENKGGAMNIDARVIGKGTNVQFMAISEFFADSGSPFSGAVEDISTGESVVSSPVRDENLATIHQSQSHGIEQ